MLEAQWERKIYMGHRGAGLRPMLICADRGDLSNRMTLRRLGLSKTKVPRRYLHGQWDYKAVREIKRLIEVEGLAGLPEVVFVEGGDMLLSKSDAMANVTPFLTNLQRIAEHYHIAIVVSAGAPKAKAKEKHALVRDRVIGSQVWGRASETIVTVEPVGDGTGNKRKLFVQHRNAASEQFDMAFIGGRLVEAAPSPVETGALSEWIYAQDDKWFTRGQAVDAMKKWGDRKYPHSAA